MPTSFASALAKTMTLRYSDPMTRDEIDQYLNDIGESALLADGFEDALIGFGQRINEPLLAVYNYDKMVEILMFRDEMTYDDAIEYIEYNVVGAWVGEQTPMFVRSIPNGDVPVFLRSDTV